MPSAGRHKMSGRDTVAVTPRVANDFDGVLVAVPPWEA